VVGSDDGFGDHHDGGSVDSGMSSRQVGSFAKAKF